VKDIWKNSFTNSFTHWIQVDVAYQSYTFPIFQNNPMNQAASVGKFPLDLNPPEILSKSYESKEPLKD
jgi:hypothetical protein